MTTRVERFETMLKTLQKATTIAVTGHANPDGDCIGSCLAFGRILEQQGKNVIYMTPDTPSSYFGFLPGVKKFTTSISLLHETDCIIVLDTGAKHMSVLSDIDENTLSQDIFVIDHHLSRQGYGTLEIVDHHASSLCGLLTELLRETHPEWIDQQVATYLFMGISTDTGHFMREENPLRTFEHAGFLLKKGADKQLLVKHLFRNNALDAIKFVGVLLQRITRTGHILRTRFAYSELKERGIDEAKIDVAIMLLASVHHDGVFVLFKSHDLDPQPYLKCSFRCQHPDMNVAWLAEKFGGGGHRASAGARINSAPETIGTLQSSLRTLLQEMNAHIEDYLAK